MVIRQVLKPVQDEAEITPNEPGQVMLPRERALKKCLVDIFSEGPAGTRADLNLENVFFKTKINFEIRIIAPFIRR